MEKAKGENPIEVRLGERFPIGNAHSFTEKKGYSYLCMWMTFKLAGKEQNSDPKSKVLNKEVDLGQHTSLVDHKNLECTQRQCEISKDIVDNYRAMFESRISAGGTEKLPYSENLRISSWSCDMESGQGDGIWVSTVFILTS